jgi:two-component system, OmpR family, response regulator
MTTQAGPRVLVVEDNEILLETLAAVFERQGLSVVTATTGEDALALLREHGGGIDWLFTDICLPGMIDGWTVADEYRMSHPLRPVAYASTAACDDRRTVVGSIFVEKPVALPEIARLARMMLGSAAPQAA